MMIKLYPENPNQKSVNKVIEILKGGGIIVYPTDTVYGMGCDIFNQKAVERLAMLRGIKLEKVHFSFIFPDLSQISEYTGVIDNPTFKLMKKNLPGPFTFILNASNKVPKIFKNKRKTIGIRIPDNEIILEIVRTLGNPVLTTSIRDDDAIIEYTTDPEMIHEKFQQNVDCVIDGGFGQNTASTIIDCTGNVPEIVRQGIGILEY